MSVTLAKENPIQITIANDVEMGAGAARKPGKKPSGNYGDFSRFDNDWIQLNFFSYLDSRDRAAFALTNKTFHFFNRNCAFFHKIARQIDSIARLPSPSPSCFSCCFSKPKKPSLPETPGERVAALIKKQDPITLLATTRALSTHEYEIPSPRDLSLANKLLIQFFKKMFKVDRFIKFSKIMNETLASTPEERTLLALTQEQKALLTSKGREKALLASKKREKALLFFDGCKVLLELMPKLSYKDKKAWDFPFFIHYSNELDLPMQASPHATQQDLMNHRYLRALLSLVKAEARDAIEGLDSREFSGLNGLYGTIRRYMGNIGEHDIKYRFLQMLVTLKVKHPSIDDITEEEAIGFCDQILVKEPNNTAVQLLKMELEHRVRIGSGISLEEALEVKVLDFQALAAIDRPGEKIATRLEARYQMAKLFKEWRVSGDLHLWKVSGDLHLKKAYELLLEIKDLSYAPPELRASALFQLVHLSTNLPEIQDIDLENWLKRCYEDNTFSRLDREVALCLSMRMAYVGKIDRKALEKKMEKTFSNMIMQLNFACIRPSEVRPFQVVTYPHEQILNRELFTLQIRVTLDEKTADDAAIIRMVESGIASSDTVFGERCLFFKACFAMENRIVVMERREIIAVFRRFIATEAQDLSLRAEAKARLACMYDGTDSDLLRAEEAFSLVEQLTKNPRNSGPATRALTMLALLQIIEKNPNYSPELKEYWQTTVPEVLQAIMNDEYVSSTLKASLLAIFTRCQDKERSSQAAAASEERKVDISGLLVG